MQMARHPSQHLSSCISTQTTVRCSTCTLPPPLRHGAPPWPIPICMHSPHRRAGGDWLRCCVLVVKHTPARCSVRDPPPATSRACHRLGHNRHPRLCLSVRATTCSVPATAPAEPHSGAQQSGTAATISAALMRRAAAAISTQPPAAPMTRPAAGAAAVRPPGRATTTRGRRTCQSALRAPSSMNG